MSNPLDNLCGPGKQLQKEAPDANELAGLLRSGTARLAVARKGGDVGKQLLPAIVSHDESKAALCVPFFQAAVIAHGDAPRQGLCNDVLRR